MLMSEIIRGGLNVSKQQADVVDHVANNLLTVVGAGAGSGKTHTSVATVLELLDRREATIDQFILITYTNTAADNIRDRLEKEIQKKLIASGCSEEQKRFWRDQVEKISSAYIGTIHSFCRMVLSTYGYDEKIAKSSEMTYSAWLRQQAFHQAISAHLSNLEEPKLLSVASDFKDYRLKWLLNNALQEVYNQGYNMEEVAQWTESQMEGNGKPWRLSFTKVLLNGHLNYKRAKLENALLDAHDLLYYTNALLASRENGPVAIKRLTQRFRYLFIDEFQDTNRLQLGLVEKLLPAGGVQPSMKGVLLVGDQKQSIFGFSGAYSSLLQELAERRGTKVLPMNVARRPTADYLALQNEIFESIGERVNGLNEKLQSFEGTFNPPGENKLTPLTLYAVRNNASIEDRIRITVDHIRYLLTQMIQPKSDKPARPIVPGDIVILTRNNKQLGAYLSGLSDLLPGIKVRSDRGGSFYHKPEIVATYRMLQAIIHYPDDYILSQAFGTPYLSNVKADNMENYLISYGKESGSPLTDWFKATYPKTFADLELLRKRVKVDPVPQFLEKLYRTFNIRSLYKDDEKAILALERLREIARNLYDNDQALNIRSFVEFLKLNILTESTAQEIAVAEAGEENNSVNFIRLMTIHRAKGLEFPIVIIPEVQEPIIPESFRPPFLVLQGHGVEVMIPGQRSLSNRYWQTLTEKKSSQFEEEMRVFYVGVTRAEQALVLIGDGPTVNTNHPQAWNTWQDPIWAGQAKLAALGADFREV